MNKDDRVETLLKLADRTRWHRADEWPPEDGVYILMIDGKGEKPHVGTGLFDAYNGGFFRYGRPIDVIGWAYYPAGEEAIFYGERKDEEEDATGGGE